MKSALATAILLSCLHLASGQEVQPRNNTAQLIPFLQDHCFDCHGEDETEGDLDLQKLSDDPINGETAERWLDVLKRLEAGEMPPKKKKQPSDGERRDAMAWLNAELDKAEAEVNATTGPPRMRRLNRVEYRNTMRDLIGHPYDPTELLSPDTVSHGFDNVGEALVVSPLHVENFVAATERILDKAINIPEKAPLRQHWRILNSTEARKPLLKDNGSWHDGHRGKNKDKIKPGFLKGNVLPNAEIPSGFTPYTMIDMTQDPPKPYEGSWDIRAFGGSQIDEGLLIREGDNAFGFKWFAYEEGMYRVRIHLSSFGPKDWDGTPPRLGIVLYPEGTLWRERLLGLNESEVIEIDLYRDNVDWYRKTNGNRHWGMKLYYQLTEKVGKDGKKVPFGVHISEIEIEGPRHPVWPPAWHRRIFPERATGEGDEAFAERVLRKFMTKAFRRPVDSTEVVRMMAIFREERSNGRSLKQALRMPLATILSSPSFLYLDESSDEGAWDLASRLSYFLWRSMPDGELFAAARSGELLRRETLLSEVDRMLKDPKSDALVEHFTRQWLGLDKLERVKVDAILYPDYDLALHHGMVGEAQVFFREILRENLSLYSFIDSDFLMLNERMARHYGISGVIGTRFRKVSIASEDRRGGVLAQAAVLTATSNGLRTMPIKRGAFILEEILADPPKPPPADVPAVEDLVPTKPLASLRERLEQHRSDPSCMNCHKKIDPLGFALENYDAIGRWRGHELVEVDGTQRKPNTYRPGEVITIRFANGSGESNDWIAILPVAEKDNRKFEQLDIWKHTTGTRRRLPNGVFHGRITLSAPNEPGDYEARLFLAGSYDTVARQRFRVAKAATQNRKAPLLLDPGSGSKSLSWVAVDATGKLPDGRAFDDIGGFKKLLMEDRKAFLKCLTEKMLVYALGRPVGFGDRTRVKTIVAELERKPTLRNLIKRIALSDVFYERGDAR